jgi:threonine synthase
MDMLKDEIKSYGIGDTVFTHSRNLEKLLDFSKIFIKFEGGNPTGTMKDRASYACLRLAKSRGYKNLVIASCGNFGASFVHLSRGFGIEAHVYIPEGYHTPRIREMEDKGGIIHWAPGTYEEVVEFSGEEAERLGWFNANPGVEANTRASLEAYATISHEIHERLGHAPDVVAVPVGNGTTIAGVHLGFKRLRDDGETDKVPVMVAASTPGGNPVVDCFLKGERRIRDLEPSEITETEHNEPLVSWRSLDGQEALDALWDSMGWATYVPDDSLLAFSEMLAHEEGLLVLPASASSLAALSDYAKNRAPGGRERAYVALLTGRRQ